MDKIDRQRKGQQGKVEDFKGLSEVQWKRMVRAIREAPSGRWQTFPGWTRGSLAWNQRTCRNFSDFWMIRSWRNALIEKWLSSAQYLRFLCQNGRRFDCSLGPFRLQPAY